MSERQRRFVEVGTDHFEQIFWIDPKKDYLLEEHRTQNNAFGHSKAKAASDHTRDRVAYAIG